MNTRRAVGLLLMLTALLVCQSAWAFYNPHTGKWLSRDPIGERGGRNLSCHTYNNAVGLVDSDGRVIAILFAQPALANAPSVTQPFQPYILPPYQPPIVFDPLPPTLIVPPVVAPNPVSLTPPSPGTIVSPTGPNPISFPPPNLGNNAPPATSDAKCKEWLCRNGLEWEYNYKLTVDAAKAEAGGFPHGLSVILFSKPPGGEWCCYPKQMLEVKFSVLKTGKKPNHYTLLAPKPVTDDFVSEFNLTFGRTKPPPGLLVSAPGVTELLAY